MNAANIVYIGEKKDYSDQWLISFLRSKYQVAVVDAADNADIETLKQKLKDADVLINRLYASSWQRHDAKHLLQILKVVRQAENKGTLSINKSQAWDLENNRLAQAAFFEQHNISYISTVPLENWQSQPGLYLVKRNHSGRHKELSVLSDIQLQNFREQQEHKNGYIVQPYINQPTCYRLEVVGNERLIYSESIIVKDGKLTFTKNLNNNDHHLDKVYVAKLCETLAKHGVQIFSIEYFIVDQKPLIIDFNVTSNYPKALLFKNTDFFKQAWSKIINYELAK